MADNTVLDAGAGGDTVVTREISHGGDTAKLQGTFVMGVSGIEGAYTAAAIDGDAANGLDVDVTRVSGTVTVDSELPAAAALADGDANPTVPAVGAFLVGWGGTTWNRVKCDPSNSDALAVVATNNHVAVMSHNLMYNGTTYDRIRGDTTNGVDVDVTRLPASTNTLEVVGDVADDAATAGNPVLIAGVAVETDGTDPTTVSAEGDAAYLRTDRARRLLVSEHHPRSFFTSVDYATAQTNASVQAAPGAGLSLYITDIVISNGATAGNITLLDGSAGTVKFEIYPAINGGVSISLRQPIRLTANTALCLTSTTVTTHSANIGGYIAP